MIVDFWTFYANVISFTFFTGKFGTESLFDDGKSRFKKCKFGFVGTRKFIMVVKGIFACFYYIVTATVNIRKYMRSRTRVLMLLIYDIKRLFLVTD